MKCLVVVAHPDDETIWMGGMILSQPEWDWRIACLSRGDDEDRAPRFYRAVTELGAEGVISDLDDSPDLQPLSAGLFEIKNRIGRMADGNYDILFTHGIHGEYTRHPRHEQVHQAVQEMVESGLLSKCPAYFAYDDCGGKCRPHLSSDADMLVRLDAEIFERKRCIIRDIYGFQVGSMEYESAGRAEAFSADSPCLTKLLGTQWHLQSAA